jgi:hypothetical protein
MSRTTGRAMTFNTVAVIISFIALGLASCGDDKAGGIRTPGDAADPPDTASVIDFDTGTYSYDTGTYPRDTSTAPPDTSTACSSLMAPAFVTPTATMDPAPELRGLSISPGTYDLVAVTSYESSTPRMSESASLTFDGVGTGGAFEMVWTQYMSKSNWSGKYEVSGFNELTLHTSCGGMVKYPFLFEMNPIELRLLDEAKVLRVFRKR